MKSYIRASLLIVSAIFALYGLGFIFNPQVVHDLLSPGTQDPATSGLVAAFLLGMSLMFLFEAQDPLTDRVQGLALALAMLGIALVLGILNGGWIKVNGATLFSVIITLGMSIYLFIVQSESVTASVAATSKPSASSVRPTSSSAPKQAKKKSASAAKKATPSRKKTSKKKVAKKAKKKR